MKELRIGVQEAKTHLSELLRQVAAGKVITITRHGRAIAEMRSPVTEHPQRLDALKDEWKDLDLEGIEEALIGEDPEIIALFEGEEEESDDTED